MYVCSGLGITLRKNMLNLYKILILVIIVTNLGACSRYAHLDVGWAKPPEFDMSPPPGPAIYQQGYKDGCESGYSGYGSSGQKMFHTWKQDPELVSDKVYYQIWKDAYGYCALYSMMESEHGLGNWR